MKVKGFILIFAIGITLGAILAPFIGKQFEAVFLSPTSLSRAEDEKQEIGEVLATLPPAPLPSSSFADLIPSDSGEKPEIKKDKLTRRSNFSGEITIAAFGDSMIDTLETDLPFLRTHLQNYYPKAKLKLFNFGLPSQNIEQGLVRIDQEYSYLDRTYASLLNLNPDIIILGSFSYNPFSDQEDELYRHWANLTKITNQIKENTEAQIIILATIAPNKENFAKGTPNWSKDFAWKQGVKIDGYLKNTVNFAQVNKIVLVDVYQKTLVDNEGDLNYIDSNDYIHPNLAGKKLISQLLAEKIYQLQLF